MNQGTDTLLFAEQTHAAVSTWIENESDGFEFRDEGLIRRFKVVLKRIGAPARKASLGQDWANAKAACRFFDNERVSAGGILARHFRATRERFAGARQNADTDRKGLHHRIKVRDEAGRTSEAMLETIPPHPSTCACRQARHVSVTEAHGDHAR